VLEAQRREEVAVEQRAPQCVGRSRRLAALLQRLFLERLHHEVEREVRDARVAPLQCVEHL